MPACPYCSVSEETEVALRAHLHEEHELTELSPIDTRRVEQYVDTHGLDEPAERGDVDGQGGSWGRAIDGRLHESIISTGRWEFHEVSELSTEEILAKLAELDIETSEAAFREQAATTGSAEVIADQWIERSTVEVFGYDDDFVWMAAIVLWKRWTPELPASEPIEEFVDRNPDDQAE